MYGLCVMAGLLATAGAPVAAKPRLVLPNSPITFERNTGHWPKDVRFVARTGRGMLFITRREAVVSIRKGDRTSTLRLKLQGSDPAAVASGLEKRPGIVNYFIGKDPKQWRTNVPTYSRVKLAGVYPGVDLVYYGAGQGRELEYDFVVKPGADPSKIRMSVSGARSLRGVGGQVVASTECGDVVLNRPYAYQTVGGIRRQVACSFELERDTVAFRVARYDASRPLVVDPTLSYCTYLGGAGDEGFHAIAVDGAGAAYVVGDVTTGGFPVTPGAYSTTLASVRDCVVAKLAADGKSLVYATYLGGDKNDAAYAVAVDATGAAIVGGETLSGTFPTTPGVLGSALGGGTDAFVVRISPAGNALQMATYLGGAAYDNLRGIALGSGGAVYATGQTNSAAFPTTQGAYSRALAGDRDAYVVKLTADGSALVYGTLFGGTYRDTGNAIAVSSAGVAYIAGGTESNNLPAAGFFQPAYGGGDRDTFVMALSADGSSLLYATYFGGTALESAEGITVDGSGCATVIGTSEGSMPLPPGGYQAVRGGNYDTFLARFAADGKSVLAGTYLGGTSSEGYATFATDATGDICVFGYTNSDNFPVTPDALQSTRGSGQAYYVAKLNSAMTSLIYGTFLGGSIYDESSACAAAGGALYFVGGTLGGIAATAGAYQTSPGGSFDGLVAKLAFVQPLSLAVADVTATAGSRTTLAATLTSGGSPVSARRLQFRIDGGAWTNSETLTSAAGRATLTLTAPAAGPHTIDCRALDASAAVEAAGSGSLTATALIGTATNACDRTSGPGDVVNLPAYLVLPSATSTGTGVAGKPIEFQFNGGSWTAASALTDATGKAALAVTAPAAVGDYTINARFLGDATHAASSGTAKLTVAAKRNAYVYTANRSGKAGSAGTLISFFYWYQKNGTLTPVSGKSLRFQCAGVSLDSTVTTDASGKATVTVTPASAGSFPFTVDFTADADYNAAGGAGTLTVAP
ncbi:MAG: Ig-like domain-containing protein [Armatimonadetes bacterium]|nr:Ig-like domain-containing protein [Armatimonadota bacterium]